MKPCGRKPTQAVSQLYTLLRDKNIPSDQPIATSDSQIKVSNVAPDRIGDFRNLVADSFPVWDAPVPAPGETNGYLLNMKSAEVSATQQRTMDQSVTTIKRRIDQLGLREPVIEPYGQGDNEIIVELAGEGDPTEAKTIIQAGGQLEIRLVEDPRPYASQAEALAAHNGFCLRTPSFCRKSRMNQPLAEATARRGGWYRTTLRLRGATCARLGPSAAQNGLLIMQWDLT